LVSEKLLVAAFTSRILSASFIGCTSTSFVPLSTCFMAKGKTRLVVLSVAIHKEDVCAKEDTMIHAAHTKHTNDFILI
jgi:hypothetical protein